MARYDPTAIEAKWQERWASSGIYETDVHNAQRPYYNLMMFPYPSAEGLHIGNVYAFTGADIHGRFMAMQGYDVFQPIGFDAFGIHSENFAIKENVHPTRLMPKNIKNFQRQLRDMGGRFAWSHEVNTTDPAYYRWTQWVFLKLFEHGLAEKRTAPVNW
ncbi:MAG: class I tRNA ligase family protein, partial [Chloroflexi bacterium]|nr:class I tRNA ligase family protein [Chloroflexota bacterium]